VVCGGAGKDLAVLSSSVKIKVIHHFPDSFQ
jgi:hypothetical protein